MHLILTGVTGVVGSAVLSHILSLPATSSISRISILTRKPVPLLSPTQSNQPIRSNPNLKIDVITHNDYLNYPPALLSQLKGANGVIWALGISQNDVSKDEYIKITKDYTLAAAKAFSSLNEQKLNFVYVSGEGATLTPGIFTPLFGRVKGETERELVTLAQHDEYKTLRVYNARPGGVDPSDDPAVMEVSSAKLSTAKQVTAKVLMPILRNCYANMHSPTRDLGRALTDLAIGDGEPLSGKGVEAEGRTVTNQGLRRLAGLKY
jgi:hypothetical protein